MLSYLLRDRSLVNVIKNTRIQLLKSCHVGCYHCLKALLPKKPRMIFAWNEIELPRILNLERGMIVDAANTF